MALMRRRNSGVDLGDRHTERPGGDELCRSSPELKASIKLVVLRQVRHDAHLDLAVVGGHQRFVPGPEDEGVADAATGVGTNRDVLQVRLGRGQPAGRGDGLIERGVDAAVVGNRFQQTVDGDLEPGRVAVLEQMFQEGVLVFSNSDSSASASVV